MMNSALEMTNFAGTVMRERRLCGVSFGRPRSGKRVRKNQVRLGPQLDCQWLNCDWSLISARGCHVHWYPFLGTAADDAADSADARLITAVFVSLQFGTDCITCLSQSRRKVKRMKRAREMDRRMGKKVAARARSHSSGGDPSESSCHLDESVCVVHTASLLDGCFTPSPFAFSWEASLRPAQTLSPQPSGSSAAAICCCLIARREPRLSAAAAALRLVKAPGGPLLVGEVHVSQVVLRPVVVDRARRAPHVVRRCGRPA